MLLHCSHFQLPSGIFGFEPLEPSGLDPWFSGLGVLHFLILQTVRKAKLMLWQFGHSQSLSRPDPAGFFWEPSSEYEPALVPIEPGLGGIKPYLSMGIPYIPPAPIIDPPEYGGGPAICIGP